LGVAFLDPPLKKGEGPLDLGSYKTPRTEGGEGREKGATRKQKRRE